MNQDQQKAKNVHQRKAIKHKRNCVSSIFNTLETILLLCGFFTSISNNFFLVAIRRKNKYSWAIQFFRIIYTNQFPLVVKPSWISLSNKRRITSWAPQTTNIDCCRSHDFVVLFNSEFTTVRSPNLNMEL